MKNEEIISNQAIPIELNVIKYLNNENTKISNTIYKIKGVVVYTSFAENFGHYISYIYEEGKWYEYNDSKVTLQFEFPSTMSKNAFLIFYERI